MVDPSSCPRPRCRRSSTSADVTAGAGVFAELRAHGTGCSLPGRGTVTLR